VPILQVLGRAGAGDPATPTPTGCSPRGRHRPDASYVTKLFKRLVAQADLRLVRWHDLRHGAASFMIAGGVDVAVISKRLGHSSIRIPADVYGHLLPGAGRQAADVTEAFLRPPAIT
jgi:integrase